MEYLNLIVSKKETKEQGFRIQRALNLDRTEKSINELQNKTLVLLEEGMDSGKYSFAFTGTDKEGKCHVIQVTENTMRMIMNLIGKQA